MTFVWCLYISIILPFGNIDIYYSHILTPYEIAGFYFNALQICNTDNKNDHG